MTAAPESRPLPAAAAPLGTVTTVLGEILDLREVPPHENFFALGGNSLLAVRVAARLGRELGRRVPATAVLEHPTAAGLAGHLADTAGPSPVVPEPPRPLPAVTEGRRHPLSAAQRRVWLLHEVDPDRLDHLVTVSFEVTGRFDPAAARTAWTRVVARHEALRARFEHSASPDGDGAEPVQVVEDEPLTEFTHLDAAALPEAVRERVVAERVRLLHTTPMPLDGGPLTRVAVLRTAPGRYRLELVAHHIVCDGWSLAVIVEDFLDAYRRVASGAPGPGGSPHRFSGHVRWEREVEAARWPELDERVARRFAGRPETLPLPTEPVPVAEHEDGDDVVVPLPEGLEAAMVAAGVAGGHTRLTLALTALGVLLHRVTGADDLLVAVPVAGRARPEDERTVGLFVNTALARVRLAGAGGVHDLLARVRREAAEVLDCQTYPFDRLVSRLGAAREGTRMPLARVSLAVQDFAEPPLPDPSLGFGWTVHDPAERQSKLDLAFGLTGAAAASPALTVTYRPSLFRRATVRAWAEQYLIALQKVTDAATGGTA